MQWGRYPKEQAHCLVFPVAINMDGSTATQGRQCVKSFCAHFERERKPQWSKSCEKQIRGRGQSPSRWWEKQIKCEASSRGNHDTQRCNLLSHAWVGDPRLVLAICECVPPYGIYCVQHTWKKKTKKWRKASVYNLAAGCFPVGFLVSLWQLWPLKSYWSKKWVLERKAARSLCPRRTPAVGGRCFAVGQMSRVFFPSLFFEGDIVFCWRVECSCFVLDQCPSATSIIYLWKAQVLILTVNADGERGWKRRGTEGKKSRK